ncbi:MAG: hypothetical protein QOF37_2501 [Thermoleophilaceae bacterium]|nr:hypothetical protein [Thermoleophilaceae bacterium]
MYAESHPNESKGRQHEGPHGPLRIAEWSLGWALAVVAVCAGVGWLYLLRDTKLLAVGPHMRGALPLEELAYRGAQPLLRMAVAWIPAGFAAGLALALTTRLRAASIAAAMGMLSFLMLYSTTVASEAVSRNERFAQHLGPVLGKSGLWAAVAFVIIGSLLAALALGRGQARRRPGGWTRRRPASSRPGAMWSSAA